MRDLLKQIKSIKELTDLLLVKYHEVASNFSNICSVVYIFITLPVTIASAVRRFSMLRVFKKLITEII